jgi:Uma2 family endonuclease
MSTVERIKTVPPLLAGQQLDQPTFHERYEAMPPKTRAELVGGVVYMPSPMRLDHGDTSRLVAWLSGQYQWKTPGVAGADGVTVMLDEHGESQPDHLLRIPAQLGGQAYVDNQGYLTGAPELIFEIARSSRSYDLNQKKADYQRAGVSEYVVIALDPSSIHWFIRRDDHFEDQPPGPDGIYRSEIFPGLWLDERALFAQDMNRLMEVLEQGLATPEHAAFAAKLAEARGNASDTN